VAPAIPIIAAVAGAGAAASIGATALGGAFTVGLLNAGIGFSAGGAIAFTGALAGFAVSTAVNAIGSRALSTKSNGSIGGGTAQEASGHSIMSRSSVESHKTIYGQTRVSGPIVMITTTNTGPDSGGVTATGDNLFLHIVIALAGHEVEEIGTIYLNDLAVSLDGNGFVQTDPYLKGGKSYVRVSKHLGTASQSADSLLLSEYSGWTSAHRLQGVAYLYVRMQWNADVFPQGIPNVSAVVKGKKVFDPRSSTTAWSDNAALCVRDYMVSDYGFNCSSDEINDDYFSAAANACDEAVTLSTGGTQDRYTINGVLDTAAGRLDNLNGLVAAMAGAVTYVQGQFRAYSGTYDAPVGDIDLGLLADKIKISPRTPRKEVFNRVQGTYIDPNKNWQATDFPPITNSTYEAQDGNEIIPRDIVLTLTNHPEAAQRIAKVILEQGRQGIQVELVLKHHALSYAVWDTVTFTNAPVGWEDKVFRIKNMRHDGVGPITLSLQEESSASYDWNGGMASTYDAAPDTNLPSPSTVSPPSALSVSEDLYVTRDGGSVKAKAILTWLASQDVFIRNYQAEYKLSTASDWTLLPRTEATTIEILDIAPGIYDFRVKGLNTLDVSSSYATTTSSVAGLSAPPTEPQNLYWSAIGGLAYLNWDSSPDLDVRLGGNYRFRYSPTTTDGWGSSTSIGNDAAGNTNHAVLPLKPGIYLIKAVDASGNESLDAASVIVTQDTIIALSLIATVTEDPTFSGTKTNCGVSGGILSLTDTSLPGTYLFANDLDLGEVSRFRLTSKIQATVVNPSDLFDDGTGDFDSGDGDFDGTSSADADAVVFARTTQTDPSGSPTWSAWNRLDSGEFVAWGVQFKMELVSFDPIYNIEISELEVKAEEV
jgi:hypothetical protein